MAKREVLKEIRQDARDIYLNGQFAQQAGRRFNQWTDEEIFNWYEGRAEPMYWRAGYMDSEAHEYDPPDRDGIWRSESALHDA